MALNNMGLGFTFKATDQASPVMKGVASNVAKTAEASKAAALSVKNMGAGFEKVGTAATLAGGVMAAGLGLAVNEAAKFQFGVAQVATEADKAKLPAETIAKLAKEMAQTYGGDLDTQIKALYQGVAAGADDAAKATALLNGANRLAIAGATSQETALLGITKVLNNYSLSYDKATDVADAFFVAVKGGQTTVGELGDAVGQVAALGKNAGLSMEELIGALGTAATLGKDTASSAAAMKAALSGIAHPTADAAAEAAKLGIKFDSVNLRSKGLVGFLKEITGSSKFTSDSMNKLFGSVEASGFMSALAADKMSALNGMMAGMSKKAGGSQAAFETMSATMKQAGSILSANLQVAMVELGDALLPVVTGVTRFASLLVKGFLALPDPVKKGIAVFAAVASAVLLVAGGVASLVAVVLTAEVPVLAVAAAFAATAGAVLPLIAIGGTLVAAVYAIKRAFDENVGGFRDYVIPIFEKVKLTWDALTQVFTQGGFSGAVRDELNTSAGAEIKNFAITAFMWFSRVENFVDALKRGFESAAGVAGPTFQRLGVALTNLGDALGKLFGGKSDPAAAAASFDKFGNAGFRVGEILEKVTEAIVSGVTWVVEEWTGFISTIQDWMPTFQRVWDVIVQVYDAYGELAKALGSVVAAFTSSNASAKDTGAGFADLVGVLLNVMVVGAKVTAWLVGALAGAFYLIGFVVQGVKDGITFMFKALIDGLLLSVGYAAKAVDALGNLFGKKNMGGGESIEAMRAKLNAPAGQPAARPDGVTTRDTVATPAPMTGPSAAPVGSASPAVAGVKGAGAGEAGKSGPSPEQMGAAMAGAMKQAPPAQYTITAPIILDGTKIGEAMGKGGPAGARSFTPGPMPAG